MSTESFDCGIAPEEFIPSVCQCVIGPAGGDPAGGVLCGQPTIACERCGEDSEICRQCASETDTWLCAQCLDEAKAGRR